MKRTIRLFLLFAGATFLLAASIHDGLLVAGYAHREAAIAETVIATVLLAGLALSLVLPAWTRPIGLFVLAFALLGTLVGVFTVAIGIGPRTVPDIVYHIAILVAQAWGLVVAARSSSSGNEAARAA